MTNHKMSNRATSASKRLGTSREMQFNSLLPHVKRITKSEGQDGEIRCVAEDMIIARHEGRKALLKPTVLIYRFTSERWRLCRIAGAAGEGNLQTRLANIIESCFDRKAEVTARAR